MNNILVTGSTGQLGSDVVKELLKRGYSTLSPNRSEFNLCSEDSIRNYILNSNCEAIVHCAAYTQVDKAEDEKDLCIKINATATKHIVKCAKILDIPMIYISTDYVFDGDLDVTKSYVETDAVGPVTVYGKTKLHGEEQVKANTDKYYIFRTAWLYGDGNNFVRTMLKLGNEKDEISVVADQHGSPTYAEDLANIIAEAIEKKIPYGLYHSTNQGFTTWYDFTKKIFELADIKCNVKPVTSEEFIRPAKRPKNSKLNKQKLLDQEVTVPEWEDGLKRYLETELH